MLSHHLKLSFRSLMRQNGYTLLNITGMGVGIAISLLIGLYVFGELQTDKFHQNYHRIYRLETNKYVRMPTKVTQMVAQALPEALEICRLEIGTRNLLAGIPDKQVFLANVIYADSSFFNIFSYELLHGDPSKVLSEPGSIVLTESEATKLFGKDYPVGKVLKLNNQLDYIVTGIMKDSPPNSMLKPTAVVAFTGNASFVYYPELLNDWNNWNYFVFLLLPVEHELNAVNSRLGDEMNKILTDFLGGNEPDVIFSLRPFSDIYFNRNIQNDGMRKGNLNFVIIYVTIGIFILIIAAINFINISTAMAFRRSREVGMKKVLGSSRGMLMRQYLIESVMVSIGALVVAIALFVIVLPFFNHMIDADIELSILQPPMFIVLVILFVIVVGLLAGLYPAFYLARFNPIAVLRGGPIGVKGSVLRKILIVFQFTISIGIILSTIVIYSQMKYARTKDMGFDRENIIYFSQRGAIGREYDVFKSQLKQIPGVSHVGISHGIPGRVGMNWGRKVNGEDFRMAALPVDPEFMDVYNLKITRGRAFDADLFTDRDRSYIINEAAVRDFGLEEPVGAGFANGTIVGVVEDFAYLSVHHPIGPLVLAYVPEFYNYISIKMNGHDLPNTLEQIEQVYYSFAPDYPFTYHFLNSSIGLLYEKEKRLAGIFLFFSVLAVFVACLGLSGLALFSTQQRTKEVGVRKVFGSSVKQIVILLTGDFLRWVLLANLIAWPLTWYFMGQWLSNFAYHISISWWMFGASALVVLVIAMLTITFQAVKTALSDPVKALKYE